MVFFKCKLFKTIFMLSYLDSPLEIGMYMYISSF